MELLTASAGLGGTHVCDQPHSQELLPGLLLPQAPPQHVRYFMVTEPARGYALGHACIPLWIGVHQLLGSCSPAQFGQVLAVCGRGLFPERKAHCCSLLLASPGYVTEARRVSLRLDKSN